ncbi:hypothetical protein A2348_04475 [Candidatus Uhrbacteria bacterium RIFOXYB12_FULL_58_10]|uniref:Uncharacterized protein n=1 Tax=Candidatus Uhrbacteria bacterium RIFOXYB2_FULL_57_15 TaxID=1802422 RepID=A0A1F7W8N5_9BACT|nr:MAG: hypothetical protein A2348_04475 [Candidatus Uhrbacteria bacterium RIFOXYB12_FULL_58_10]OGL98748.1 MAG: hypothetical protein A2304_01030 [Candidatus Uhrbacteria bacterium RIFOXYB2_FULL_57_15]OGL99953.1 MAG: hypothetical protein A2501_04360 [Candidatus Uhrbacteria bacterium RIFOXYC12_FULL_57_11]
MFITVITDCRDANAQSRQETRYAELFPGTHVSFVGVTSDIEAAGNLIDMLDAAGDAEGVVAVNVAPRHGRAKEKWPNGTPFGYLWFKKVLIVCTIDGETLSLLKKFDLADRVNVTDIREVMAFGGYDAPTIERAATSQFRSFDYLPRLARIVWEHKRVPCEVLPFSEVPDAGLGVWWIDSFGNCKTTLLQSDIQFEEGAKREIVLNKLAIEATCYAQLRSVPDYYTGLIAGSSGYGDRRFIELVVQGSSAAKHYQISQKDTFEINVGEKAV